MQTFFLITLFIFGLMFGSFASVIIYRLKSGEKGILGGRSHCGSCNKILQALDLIPLFSWIINKGKCRRCKAKVSSIYPFLELSTGILFASIGAFIIDYSLILSGNIGEIITLTFWLALVFVSILYIFYDILFLEIHEGVMFSGVGVALLAILIQIFSGIQIFPSLPLTESINFWSIGILFLTIAGLYTIILKGLSEIWDIIIIVLLGVCIYIFSLFFENITSFPAIAASIGALAIFSFFFIQILISKGKWMGGGDLRIAILVGIILGTTLSFPAMMLTYFAGSIIGIGFILHQRIIQKKPGRLETQVPFGPFIAIGFFLAVFFQDNISEFIERWFYL